MRYIFIVFLSIVLLTACKENYVAEEAAATNSKINIPAVRVADIALTTEPIPITASGMVGAQSEIKLAFKMGGIINKIYVSETQRVKKGQLLASLRTTEVDAKVKKTQQKVVKATRDVERIQKMYADSVATLENVEDLTTVLDFAKSDLEIAKFNQTYSKIIAPVSGKVLKKLAENNELIGPGVPVFQIASNAGKGYNLKIGVADKDIPRIKLGDKATIIFDAYPTMEFAANVSEIAEAADPRTGVFPVELSITPQKGVNLRNGFIGKVALFPSNQVPYYKIPMNALVEGYKNKANIYTINGDTARKVSVRPAYIGNDFFTIQAEDLEGVAQVITDGAAYLKNEMVVKVVE